MIIFQDVQVIFNGIYQIHALKSINVHIKQGEWITILGPSGSGKTTFLNVISGIEKATEGLIKVNDQNLITLQGEDLQQFRRNTVSYIYQDFRLFPQFSVLENVMMPQIPYRPLAELKKRAKELIESLHLSHRLHHLPGELSGGEKQRVTIARALLNEPKILLCDEPTGNLDSENRKNILEVLKKLHNDGMTIVLVTHDTEISSFGNREFYMREGVLKERVTV